jgi:hypothetical protein
LERGCYLAINPLDGEWSPDHAPAAGGLGNRVQSLKPGTRAMSTSLSPRSSGSSSHPTRQQLDELDALLQRMLALPVNQAGDEVIAEIDAPLQAAPVTKGQGDKGTRGQGEEMPSSSVVLPRFDEAHVAATEDESGADAWVPLSSTWKPSPHTWKPLAQSWQQPRMAAPTQEMPLKSEELDNIPESAKPDEPPAPAVAPVQREAKPPIVPEAPVVRPQLEALPPLAAWQKALVGFNVAFDLLLLPWGPPGRWLRRDGGGRSLLGGLGILLLAAAVGLGVKEWFGWTWEDILAKIR